MLTTHLLARGLNLGVHIFGTKTTDIMTIINLVILDVVHGLREYQVLEQFNEGATVHRRTTQALSHYTPGQDDVVPPKPRKSILLNLSREPSILVAL